MDEFEQRDLDKETNDSHGICYQITIRYEEKENTFMKNCIVMCIPRPTVE